MPRKRVIVASLIGISVPTLLAATSSSLAQLVFWRFLQGVTVPGVIAVLVTYIGEEWPPERVALIMSFYVSGTALGGFVGRISAGFLADWFNWRISFLALGAAALAGAGAVALWLPPGRRRTSSQTKLEALPPFPYQVQELFRSRRLVATFAVGFNVLFSLVGVFTWITFHLSAAPFNLSTAALSSLFFVYLVGLVVTPAAGYLITRVGLRAGIGGAIACSIAGVLLTLARSLPVVIVGLTHALERRLHCADCLAEPSARGCAAGRARHSGGALPDLLLPGRHGGRGGPGSFLGAGQVAGVRRRSSSRCRSSAGRLRWSAGDCGTSAYAPELSLRRSYGPPRIPCTAG